jgi:hypothetical protein
MISTFTSPSYVNWVKESWQPGYGVTQSGGAGSPTLYFDFLTGVLNPAITFTRASTATYFNSAGTLTSAAINEARFDYNPSTLAAQGFLIEESRTNSIRNNTAQGAVAGSPGTLPTNWSTFTPLTGLTREIVGTGTESGISYIDVRLSGTPSAAGVFLINFESSTQNAASNGQTWSGSTYCKFQAGSLTGISSLILRTSALDISQVELSSTSQTFTPTSAALNTQRNVAIHTNISASTAYEIVYLRISLSGVAIDITLRIGLPQLELGAFATSVIPTTTTALTRAADVASVNTLSPWYNASAGTLYAEYNIPFALTSGTNPKLATLLGAGGAAVDELPLFIAQVSGRAASANAFTGAVNAGRVDASASFAANTTTKATYAYASNDRAVTTGGSSPTISTAAYTIPTVTLMRLGSQDGSGTSNINGYLRRVTYYPTRLSNAQLQAITT